MTLFRAYLAIFFLVLAIYTIIVISRDGWNLLAIFFGDIRDMFWPGQFNLDFMGFLGLSGLWLAWRHHFSPAGLALGVLGFFGGMGVLAPYLLITSFMVNGDMARLLMGSRRAHALGHQD